MHSALTEYAVKRTQNALNALSTQVHSSTHLLDLTSQCQSKGDCADTVVQTDASSGCNSHVSNTSHQLLADAFMKKRGPVSSALDVEHDEVVCWH